MFKGRTILPEVETGSYWICKSVFVRSLSPTDIFCKVLKVTDNKVFILRKTEYGFKDLPPQSFDVEMFLELYLKLEDVKE